MRLQNRRVLGAGVSALGAALVLAGCGAGQITQTDTQQPAVNGTYAQVQTLVLRNAAVQYQAKGAGYAAGDAAPLTLAIVNQGQRDDKLVSVTSAGTTSPATVTGDTAIVAGHSLVIGPADAVESTNEQNAPGSSSPAVPPSSNPPSSSAPSSAAAASSSAAAKPGVATVVLQGLKQPLWSGMTIPVTFTFQNAGPIVVDLPVAAPAHARS
ncbi:hypothetical protein ATK36_3997 [Amycolatopsis sulphurea]|uniref:Copper(I)-binding protein n=1 Tax=Amycolatopsis sulphurea TaxID=76022 RepID=A0A2A9FEF4_9PSEU|nr:hypothetical protein [Amycolatopsis sulphurea]PFG48880.1 hypothetical protein ATK36_3997 [Amycolatopsis sulphurea]